MVDNTKFELTRDMVSMCKRAGTSGEWLEPQNKFWIHPTSCVSTNCCRTELPEDRLRMVIIQCNKIFGSITCKYTHYATNRQVAGSTPDGVIGFFQWHNPFGRTMALGSTQPLTEMSTRCISWGKGGQCVRLTTLPPSCAVVRNWEP